MLTARFSCVAWIILLVWPAVFAQEGNEGGERNKTQSAKPFRSADPVLLTGKQIEPLAGVDPADCVACRFDKKWEPLPVQVDERAEVGYLTIYKGYRFARGFRNLVYADPGAFTGADPNPKIDENDEVVFMLRDAGNKAPAGSEPAGVVRGTGLVVELSDPKKPERKQYVYLFRAEGKAKPAAGKPCVEYAFKLKAGAYRTKYQIARGPNPEDSTVRTAVYRRHFSDRWISDELRLCKSYGTGVDILDQHKSLFRPGWPTRSVKTFSRGEGVFIANISGPVRAIRSYLGCNSGPLTQRTHFFYERREDIVTDLRVHSIPGIMDFFDYSPAAIGMRYHNNLNPKGVKIDGRPEELQSGRLDWELVVGKQGGLVILHEMNSDLGNLKHGSYTGTNPTPARAR